LCKIPCGSVASLHVCCVSARRRKQNGDLQGAKKSGSYRVLNWERKEDEGEQIPGADVAVKALPSVFWDVDG
jgi:hypothetical protein